MFLFCIVFRKIYFFLLFFTSSQITLYQQITCAFVVKYFMFARMFNKKNCFPLCLSSHFSPHYKLRKTMNCHVWNISSMTFLPGTSLTIPIPLKSNQNVKFNLKLNFITKDYACRIIIIIIILPEHHNINDSIFPQFFLIKIVFSMFFF